MAYKTIIEDGIDILVAGAGLGGTGAAWEARFWGQKKKIVIAEKANIDRSGAVAHHHETVGDGDPQARGGSRARQGNA